MICFLGFYYKPSIIKYYKSNILVIRFSSIGDIILVTPILRALKIQLDASVTFLTNEKFKSVLKHNPNINNIVTYGNFDINPNQFDLIIDLQKNIRSTLLTSKFKAPTITFNKMNIKKWILVNLKLDLLPDYHLVDRYFLALSSIGIVNDNKGLDFNFREISITHFNLPNEFNVINCGGTYFTKRIPKEKVLSLIAQSRLTCVLLGGNDVIDDFLEIAKEGSVINLIGRTTLDESAFIIKSCNHLFTSDSALMHIGAAFNKNITILWGNTSPKFGMYPYQVDNNKIKNYLPTNLKCHPCSKIGYAKCPLGHFKCMRDHQIVIDNDD